MVFPRFLAAVVLIAAGAFLPALGKDPTKAAPGSVGMTHEEFAITEITIHQGETLTFTNDSRYMHIIGPGRDGTLEAEAGDPMKDRALVPVNGTFTTPPFDTLGVFNITCSMHPDMTVRVTVIQ